MQKKIFLTVIALFAVTAVFSQVRYQGHLAAGYGIQIGWADANPVNVETTHGVRINPHLFTGAGIGLNYRSSLGTLVTMSTAMCGAICSPKGRRLFSRSMQATGFWKMTKGSMLPRRWV